MSIKQAFHYAHEPWTPLRVAEGRRQLEKKRVQRRVARATALTLVVASIVLLVAMPRTPSAPLATTSGRMPGASAVAASTALVDGALLLSDGSYAEPLASDTALVVDEDGSDRVRVALIDGAARFDVVPNPARNFVVSARGLRIEVIGTRFEVELESTRGHVRVLRGHVRVTWSRGRRDLHGGQSGLFPLDDGEAQAVDAQSDAIAPTTAVEAVTPTVEPPAQTPRAQDAEGASAPATSGAPGDWRRLAREGDYDSAYRASREQTVGSDMEDLLLAADAARLSGHPGDAVPFLERALSLHSADPRAHLAAFTLGRVHLQLGRNREAARDFAQVERLDRRRVLVEQALAREVEAWARAGDVQQARERAAVYLRRFPEGTYAERVRRFSSPP